MRTFAFLAAGFICCLPANCAFAHQAEDAVQVFQKVEPSVVALESIAGSGTGIVIDKAGHILTNAHVVALPLGFRCLVEVEREGRRQTVVYKSVKVLGVHTKLDLALAKIDASEHNIQLAPATLLKKKAETGQRIYAIGNPGMEGGVTLRKTITEGLLSGVDRQIDEVPYYQFSAPINPGNSGGPLCDRSGNVIGLVTLKRMDLEGVGFAIPLDSLKRDDFRPLAERKGDPLVAAQCIAYADAIMTGLDRVDPRIKKTRPVENLLASALQAYREALLADPANPKTYTAIGEVLTSSKDFDAAESHFVSALEIAPWGNDSRHYRAYGALKLAQLQPRDAEIIWLEGLAKHPTQSRQILEDLAALYRDQKQWSEFALCANMAVVVSMAFPEDLKGGMPNIQMAMESMAHVSTSARSRGSAQIRELPLDLTRQILHRNALLKSKRLVITREFGELMTRKNAGLGEKLLADTPVIELPALSKVDNLLAAADPAKVGVGGRWEANHGIWTSPESPQTGLGLTAELPPEFDLVVAVERLAGQGELAIAVPCQQQKVMFIVDYGGSKSGIAGVRDGLHTSPVLSTDSPVSLCVRVRKDVFAVSANGREIYSRATSDGLPAVPGTWQIPSTASAFIGARNARYRIYGCWVLTPGKSLARPDVASRPTRPSRIGAAKSNEQNKVTSRKVNAQAVELREVGSHPCDYDPKAIAFSPDNQFLAIGSLSGSVEVFDWAKKRISFKGKDDYLGGQIPCLAFASAGNKLLVPKRGTVQIWDLASDGSLKQTAKTFLGHTNQVNALDISKDGKFAITACSAKRVRYWDIESCRELLVFEGFQNEPAGLRFFPDGTKAWTTDGAKIHTLDLVSGDASQMMTLSDFPRTDALSFSASGRLLGVRGLANDLRLLDLAAGKEVPTFAVGRELVNSSAWSSDDSLLFVGGDSVAVWDIAAQQRVALWNGVDKTAIRKLAISPDGRHLAASLGHKGVYVLEIHRPDSNPVR